MDSSLLSASRPQLSRGALVAVASLEIVSMAVWVGGLVALGAVTAPLVFGMVSMPTSADTMTAIFQRFDKIAMTFAALALATEAMLALRGGKSGRGDLVRSGIVTAAAALAIVQGAWLSPAIAGLHQSGVVRGVGDAGLTLDRTHHWAEVGAKGQVLFLLLAIVLVVVKVARASAPFNELNTARAIEPSSSP